MSFVSKYTNKHKNKSLFIVFEKYQFQLKQTHWGSENMLLEAYCNQIESYYGTKKQDSQDPTLTKCLKKLP